MSEFFLTLNVGGVATERLTARASMLSTVRAFRKLGGDYRKLIADGHAQHPTVAGTVFLRRSVSRKG